MSREGVIAVLLPATSLASHLPFADGRRLVAAGVAVAIGTDFNPNTWSEPKQLVVALASHHDVLLPAAAITAARTKEAHLNGRAAVPIVLPWRMMLFAAIVFVSRRAPSYRQELSAMLPFPRNTAGPT